MFVMYEKEKVKAPVKVWLKEREDLERSCLERVCHLSQLPFLHKWVSLMSDTHVGMGMPIGGIIVADGVVIPNTMDVGVSYGMAYTETNIKAVGVRKVITGNGSLLQAIIGDVMRNVLVGLAHYRTTMPSYTMDGALEEVDRYEEDGELLGQLEVEYYQAGTLGGGDHFIELQEDDDGYLAITIHSRSRHLRKPVCDYLHYRAGQLNQKWFSTMPDKYRLASLPVDTREGKQYLNQVQSSVDSAKEDREKMVLAVKAILEKWIGGYIEPSLEFSYDINCHHNYTSFENHYGKDVWVHREDAANAQNERLAVISGTMGSYSYVVTGKGGQESFRSSSHEVGRQYSGEGVMATSSREKVILDLQK